LNWWLQKTIQEKQYEKEYVDELFEKKQLEPKKNKSVDMLTNYSRKTIRTKKINRWSGVFGGDVMLVWL